MAYLLHEEQNCALYLCCFKGAHFGGYQRKLGCELPLQERRHEFKKGIKTGRCLTNFLLTDRLSKLHPV